MKCPHEDWITYVKMTEYSDELSTKAYEIACDDCGASGIIYETLNDYHITEVWNDNGKVLA